MSNILSAIWNWLGDNKAARDRELKSFVQSEYKKDWEYAYHSLKETRQLPANWDRFSVR